MRQDALLLTPPMKNVVILYDRMTPAAQQRLIERFVYRDPERLVQLTTLRARIVQAQQNTSV